MENNNTNLNTEAGQEILDQFLTENNIPCTADCIVDELNDPTCNVGIFNAGDITVKSDFFGLDFIDNNGNVFRIRVPQYNEELIGWKKYVTDEKFKNTCMTIRREAMEKSGGEDVVWQIGLNIATLVEFGTNGINDEYRQAREQVEELEREMGGE